MQKFRFRLERILQWQEQQRLIHESRLKVLVQEVENAQAALARVKSARVAAEHQVISAQTIHPRDLVALAEFRLHSIREEAARLKTVQECEQRAVRERALWQAAERKRRTLVRLKEKRWREHESEENREMEAFASEMFLARWRPARGGPENPRQH